MADSCRFCSPHKFISHLNRYTVYIQIYSSDYDDRLSVLTMYYIVADRYFLCFDCFGGRNSWLMFHLCLMASRVSFDRSGSFQSSGKGTRLDAERSCFVFVSLFKEGTTKDWTTFQWRPKRDTYLLASFCLFDSFRHHRSTNTRRTK